MKWQIRPKHPLKLFNLAQIFTGYSILQQWMKLHWSQDLKCDIKDFSLGEWGWPAPPQRRCVKYIIICCIWSPYLNFLHVLKINKDILSTFGALHLITEMIEFEYCCKMVKNRCKSAKTSTKYWSIILKFGQKIGLAYTKSNCIGFRITSSIAVIIGVIYELQKACSLAWLGVG